MCIQVYGVGEIVEILIWIFLIKDVALPPAPNYDRGKNEKDLRREEL